MSNRVSHTLAATGLPASFYHAGEASMTDITLKSVYVARDIKCVVINDAPDELLASIGEIALENGWPKLQELDIAYSLSFPESWGSQGQCFFPFPALKVLRLRNIPGLIDAQTFFAGFAQLLRLQQLELYGIRFQTPAGPVMPPALPFRLKFFSFMCGQHLEEEGTLLGWHLPISASSASPRSIEIVLNDAEALSPLVENPRCLSDVTQLTFLDYGQVHGCLPMKAYAAITRLCPKLEGLYLIGWWGSFGPGLTEMLADIEAPLRWIYLRFYISQVPTLEDLHIIDRILARLLRTSRSLRSLRRFNIDARFHTLPDLEFTATRSFCLSRSVMFYHGV